MTGRTWPPCEVDEHGLNVAIEGHVLPDDEMRALGFTDRAGTTWYWSRTLRDDVSLNVTIPKDGGRLRIDVLDEMFCQPYDYQAILARNGGHPIAHQTYEDVERELARLTEAGVITGHVPGDYI